MLRERFIKRGMAVLLASAMIWVAAGCGKGQEENSAGIDKASTEDIKDSGEEGSESQGFGTKEEAGSEGGEVSYPLADAAQLSFWGGGNFGPVQEYDVETSPFHSGLEKRTGVKIDWQFVPEGTDEKQAYSLLLTDEELPDMIAYTILTSGDGQRLIDEGVIRDLSELLPKYAPHYYQYLQEHPDLNKVMKTDKGSYYCVGFFRESEWNCTYMGPVMRKDWLDALKLEVPETIDEWDTVLRAFKENYGAGMCFVSSRAASAGLASGFDAFSTFDINFYVDWDGAVQCSELQPEYRAYLEKLHQWYEEGLLDPDFTTVDDSGMRTKALNNEVGASFTAISQISAWTDDAEKENTGVQWIGVPYPVVTKGDKAHLIQADESVYAVVTVVTTSCTDEEIETALRWLDYPFTEEGFMYWNFGTEGETYTYVDGEPVYTDMMRNDPQGISHALATYCGTQYCGIGIQAASVVKQKNVPVAVDAVDTWISNTDYRDYRYSIGAVLSTEESNEYSTLYNAAASFAKEMQFKFIVGDEPMENYDDFVARLETMGVARMLEIKQAAYDRFLAR